MNYRDLLGSSLVTLLALMACHQGTNNEEIPASTVTLFHTNDIESVYDPIDAYWIDSIDRIGGFAYLATLITQERAKVDLSFLFDAGDIYTGALSAATEGALPFDLYSAIGYDAMAMGNHEFEYGWEALRETRQRARFPFLNAKIFYEDTDIPFGQAYAILERQGVRVGVVSVMGEEAFFNTIHPKHREGLRVADPATVLQPLVDRLRSEVDLIVALTHQNKSAPMQSDKEVDLEVQRGFDEDYQLAGEVTGIDVIFGGHSDHGLWEPVQHPVTGTWIGLTFGQGMHLGFVHLQLQPEGPPNLLDGGLLAVNADVLQPDPDVESMIHTARMTHPELQEVAGQNANTGYRKYYRESNIGLWIADVLKESSQADVGWMNPGSFRADLDEGEITYEELKNIYPFMDKWEKVAVNGSTLQEMLEYSLSLTFGMAQLSGVEVTYDPEAPENSRVRDVLVGGEPLVEDRTYTLTSSSYLTHGGDGYGMLADAPRIDESDGLLIDDLIKQVQAVGTLELPEIGRVRRL